MIIASSLGLCVIMVVAVVVVVVVMEVLVLVEVEVVRVGSMTEVKFATSAPSDGFSC